MTGGMDSFTCKSCDSTYHVDDKSFCRFISCSDSFCYACLETKCPTCNEYQTPCLEYLTGVVYEYLCENHFDLNQTFKNPLYICQIFANGTGIEQGNEENHDPRNCDCEINEDIYNEKLNDFIESQPQSEEELVEKLKEIFLDNVEYRCGVTGIENLVKYFKDTFDE